MKDGSTVTVDISSLAAVAKDIEGLRLLRASGLAFVFFVFVFFCVGVYGCMGDVGLCVHVYVGCDEGCGHLQPMRSRF